MHRTLATVGISLDALGAILLSTEVIGVPNLRRFAERLAGFGQFLIEAAGWRDSRGPFVGLSALVGMGVALLLAAVMLYAAASPLTFGEALVLSPYAFAGLVGVLGAIFAATAWTVALTGVVAAQAVDAVAWIEARTADGTLGVLGAGLLVVGFGMQLAAVWV